ncbi:Glucose-specific phosphotransferase enzyme IIA component [compost metagenome]
MLDIQAPIKGNAVALENVPDPAFASGAMGQGIAIEPEEGKVFAPFDGTVSHVIKSKHAIILEHESGVQILIHVGINTVALKGSGYTPHVQTGDRVKAGQLLLEFDRELVADAGYSLVTPIILPDGQDRVDVVEETKLGLVQHQGDVILRVHLKA